MKKQVIFKLLLESFDKQKNLLKYLTESEIEQINSLPKVPNKFDSKMFFQDTVINGVHYSWFIPFLNICSSQEASLFLQVMKPDYKKALKKLLNLEDIKEEITPILKEFLQTILLRSLLKKEEALIPKEYLFDSKLNVLLALCKKDLIKVINLLSMYDLAKELKFVVEQKKLKKIYSYLDPQEKSFLKTIYNHNEGFASQKIMIEKYDSKKKLRNILHMRGLMRFSLALSGESIDLIWYVCHYLDIGRGNYIFKKCKKEKTRNISNIITSEILKIINFFKEPKVKT